ncbi:MAG: hypothetical protein ACP6IS_10825 [Candidatus Asgardarchaeia archaeon]
MILQKNPLEFLKEQASDIERQILSNILGEYCGRVALPIRENKLEFNEINQFYCWILWGLMEEESIKKFTKFCKTHQQNNGSWKLVKKEGNIIEEIINDKDNVWVTSRIALCLMKLNVMDKELIEKSVNFIMNFINNNGTIGEKLSSTWAALATLYTYGIKFQDPIIQKGIKILTRTFYRKLWYVEELVDLLLSLQEMNIFREHVLANYAITKLIELQDHSGGWRNINNELDIKLTLSAVYILRRYEYI